LLPVVVASKDTILSMSGKPLSHLGAAAFFMKLELGEHLQSTIYNLQSVELGGLSPADMRVYPTVHAPRFQARAAVSVIPASLITGVSLHSPTL
jgi:hypothetical protein